jgi:adenosylcobyric acid synthase
MRETTAEELVGYEIHMGRTVSREPWLKLTQRGAASVEVLDGASNSDGRVWGCYLHGLFANATFRRHWLNSLADSFEADGVLPEMDRLNSSLDRLADAVEAAISIQRITLILDDSVRM